MGHRINEWVRRLMVPVCGVATLTLLHSGVSVRRALAIVLTLCGAMILVCIGVDPGHRTKGLVEGLKNRLR
jgi:hypothetical protein